MFTGIIEEIGIVHSVVPSANGIHISIKASKVLEGTNIGDSICIDGACQTVTQLGNDYFVVFASKVTLGVTTLGLLKPGSKVNLERALQPSGRLGGHIVQGHVDGVGLIESMIHYHDGLSIAIRVPDMLQAFIVPKGSIAVDGISLTVVDKKQSLVELYCIPETIANTTLAQKRIRDQVNIEVDIIAKYVYYMLRHMQKEVPFEQKLKDEGFWS